MVERSLARRYAMALFNVAKANNELAQVEADMAAISDLQRTTPALMTLLRNPVIPEARKESLLLEVFGGKMSERSVEFLRLLVQRNRVDVLQFVHDELRHLMDEAAGVKRGSVKSAIPLTEDVRERLKASLEAKFGCKLVLDFAEEASLIGGVLARVGDVVIDGTVRGRLRALRQRLAAARV
jgi:F-type H+-transporting ATPase subunit delta